MNVPKHQSPGFTLTEFLITMGIVGIIAVIVLVAINPSKQVCQAQNAKRAAHKNELKKALDQYYIDNGIWVSENIPHGMENATNICKNGFFDPECINVDFLIPTYIADLPVDLAETSALKTGYAIYLNEAGVQYVKAIHERVCGEE